MSKLSVMKSEVTPNCALNLFHCARFIVSMFGVKKLHGKNKIEKKTDVLMKIQNNWLLVSSIIM